MESFVLWMAKILLNFSLKEFDRFVFINSLLIIANKSIGIIWRNITTVLRLINRKRVWALIAMIRF